MMCTCFDSGRQQFEYQREEVKMKRPFTQASGSRKSVNCVRVCACVEGRKVFEYVYRHDDRKIEFVYRGTRCLGIEAIL